MSLLGLKYVLACSSLGLVIGVLAYDNGAIPRGQLNFHSVSSGEAAEGGQPHAKGQQITCNGGGDSEGYEVPDSVHLTEDLKRRLIGEDGRCLQEEGEEEEDDDDEEEDEDEDEDSDLETTSSEY